MGFNAFHLAPDDRFVLRLQRLNGAATAAVYLLAAGRRPSHNAALSVRRYDLAPPRTLSFSCLRFATARRAIAWPAASMPLR
jgi:hypothetical protein